MASHTIAVQKMKSRLSVYYDKASRLEPAFLELLSKNRALASEFLCSLWLRLSFIIRFRHPPNNEWILARWRQKLTFRGHWINIVPTLQREFGSAAHIVDLLGED